MIKVYIYVVDRDLGFAPNPFHGYCTLATCKPRIRNTATIGDWVVGVGGKRLKATGKCVFAMRVSRKITFNQYWEDPEFTDKKPVRNGSKTMLLGDNIYYQNAEKIWHQAHSHHSNPDGSLNAYNQERDTQSSYVLLSNNFYYFGDSAPIIPPNILEHLGYENGINHRVYGMGHAEQLINWLEKDHADSLNIVVSDPYNFDKSEAHYSVATNRLTN